MKVWTYKSEMCQETQQSAREIDKRLRKIRFLSSNSDLFEIQWHPTRLNRNINGLFQNFYSILSIILFKVRQLLSPFFSTTRFSFERCAKWKKEKNAVSTVNYFIGWLTPCLRRSLLVDLFLRSYFSNLQHVSRLFPRKYVGTRDDWETFFLANMFFITKSKNENIKY